jgi:hypothetical protein
LRFDIDFDRLPVEGTAHDADSGSEFDLFAVSGSHPAFQNNLYFGITFANYQFAPQRLLSNGDRFDGYVITAVDIFINIDSVLDLEAIVPTARRPAALQRLLMHEIGHGLGLGHPNTYDTFNKNYDTDSDPLDAMVIDPHDPFATLAYSENRDRRAIMSNERRHVDRFLFYTELQNDDRGGRDALYPSLHVCPGDCGGDGRVDIVEILTAVTLALEDGSAAPCARVDANGDGRVSVDEIIAAVVAALTDCSASTPTPIPSSQAAAPSARAS